MSSNEDGRPPVPGMDGMDGGSDETVKATPVSPVPDAAGQTGEGGSATQGPDGEKHKGKKHGHHKMKPGVKTALIGACSGVVGAAAIVLALNATGVIGNQTVTTTSGSGQTINITANSEDATVAKAAAAKALPSVVSVNVTTSDGSGIGSGVILDTEGDIITNYHVVDGATAVSVTIDGKSYDATIVGSDASSDIAVIKVDLNGTSVTPIEVGDSDSLEVGDWVMSVGSPFGLDQSVSAGIVSALTRNQLMESSSGETLYTNLIQTDAAINPGNSGGALVNDEGKLVGICTLYSSSTESSASVGFAIPGNYAVKIAKEIISGETVTHPYIGLTMTTVNSQTAYQNNLSVSQGALVVSVTDGSPAADAGIQKGDVITAVDGEEITSADGMILNVRSHEIGDKVKVTFVRDGKEQTVEVTLGSDEALQQEQQSQSQTQTQGTGTNGNTDSNTNGNGTGTNSEQQYLEELYNYLYNNDRGGSYDTNGTTTTTDSTSGAAAA
ncbi:S1C family serine protease [Olsenella porci]|uniref:PDZ domain-containing protein n=1 Tax=Olsenella porci TaxID=2652279 RepID=A0A6N7XDY9_9ACTN|nr:trypsin-like peptidase domain-containing protein [Olsenella porci]MST72533.1 PDZ domain-containing protein [Olsenella porci]